MPHYFLISREVENRINQLNAELSDKDTELSDKNAVILEREQELVREKALKYLNPRLSRWRFLYLLSCATTLYICIVIILVGMAVSLIFNSVKTSITVGSITSVLTIVCTVLTEVLDETLSKRSDGLKSSLRKLAQTQLEKQIQAKEGEYANRVIDYILTNTSLF